MRHYQEGRPLEAERLFSSAIKHNPRVSRFYLCRARARRELKNNTGSCDDLLTALLLDPDSEECTPLLARTFPGKTSESLLASERARQLSAELEAAMPTKEKEKEVVREEDEELVAGRQKLSDLEHWLEAHIGVECSAGESEPAEEERAPSHCEQDSQPSTQNQAKSHSNGETNVSNTSAPYLPSPPALGPGSELSLPPLAGPGLRPQLHRCLQESHFHSTIYYRKKDVSQLPGCVSRRHASQAHRFV